MSSTDPVVEFKSINSLNNNNNETNAIILIMPSNSDSTTLKKTQIHVTENQVHDAAAHFKLQEETLFLNKSQSYQNKRSNILKIKHSGIHRFLPRFLHFNFENAEFEKLYREYYENEKRTDFKTLILIIFIVNLSFFIS